MASILSAHYFAAPLSLEKTKGEGVCKFVNRVPGGLGGRYLSGGGLHTSAGSREICISVTTLNASCLYWTRAYSMCFVIIVGHPLGNKSRTVKELYLFSYLFT